MFANNFYKIISLFLVGSIFVLATLANANAESAIAIVNIQTVMKDSTAANSARKQLKSKQEQFQKDLAKQEKDLQAKDKELVKQKSLLSKEEFEKQVIAFRKQAANVQKGLQTKRASLNKAFNTALSDIQKTVTAIVSGIAAEKGFDVALPASHTLYFKNSIDISAEVLSRLNKKMPDMKVKF